MAYPARKSERDRAAAGPTLPPGVLPNQAARAYAWLWWMGQKNHRNALARRAFRKVRAYNGILAGRWASYRAPYRAGEHPSAGELLHAVLGVQPAYGDRIIRGRFPLPAHHAETLADDLERTFGGVPELIAELRQYAAHRRATIGKGLPRGKKVLGKGDPLD